METERSVNVLLITDDARPVSTSFHADDSGELAVRFIEYYVQNGLRKDQQFYRPIIAAYINDSSAESLIHVEVLYQVASFTLVFKTHNQCYTREFVREVA